ncbi:aldo/keto reductase [Clostridium polynesiense]|uniref:aldo/keto reductase n=1 Tax=Clostridium polynesiense TaxID=1325933 RepID=UPI00058BA694|nr:aldo/keto reductase [Clostridium polynesiense]
MKYTHLGRTGLKVSKLCLGTMNFGPRTEEKEAFKILDRALDAGINYIDTANIYGSLHGQHADNHTGWTEEILGRWFAQGEQRRDRVILATKVYCNMHDETEGPNGDGNSAFKIRRHVEGSLRRLQTDHIDIYQMHHIERHAPWEEIWGAFERVINQGKATYIGSCNFAARHLVAAQANAEKRNFLGLVSEQDKYNLANRLPELEVLPATEELGIAFLPWSPLHGGYLSGSVLKNAANSRGAEEFGRNLSPEKHKQLEEYSALCRELGESEANVALAWLLANPRVTAPIIGPRTMKQLEDALHALEIELSDEVLQRLDEIFPGPGGAAPEAYAW